jgi:hypothetical protein
MKTIKATLAQVANDIEHGNAREYCNAEQTAIKVGSFDTFADFASYFNLHYRPLLERIQNGDEINKEDRHLLNFLASDILGAMSTEEEDESDPDDFTILYVTFADTDNYERAKRFFDSEGPSQFWASDWDDDTRTIEFAEANDPEALGNALCEEMSAEGLTGYTWGTMTPRL